MTPRIPVVLLLLFCIPLCTASKARADKVTLQHNRASHHAAIVLESAEFAITTVDLAAEVIALRYGKQVPRSSMHQVLRGIVGRLPNARAFIVLGEDGRLLVDSSIDPPPTLNLAKRKYFRRALRVPGQTIIAKPVIGKSSGLPFVPVAKYFKKQKIVVVGIVPPQTLFKPRTSCKFCVNAIVNDGTVLASWPAGTDLPQHIIDLVQNIFTTQSLANTKMGAIPAVAAWKRSELYSIVAVSLLATAATDVDE